MVLPKISPKGAFGAEIFGIILLLLSAGWQIFIEQPTDDLYQDSQFALVNEKLNDIWLGVEQTDNDVSKPENHWMMTDWKQVDNDFNNLPSLKHVQNQTDFFRIFRGGLFLFGTILVAAGRYFEIHGRSQGMNSDRVAAT